MDLSPRSSPEQTQFSYTTLDDDYRIWLEMQGIPKPKVDGWSRIYNARRSKFEDDTEFLGVVKGVVQDQGCRHVNFRAIESELQMRMESKSRMLERQCEAVESSLLMELILHLPVDKRPHAIGFLRSDAYNDRMNFIAEVLPILTDALVKARSFQSPNDEQQHAMTENSLRTQGTGQRRKRNQNGNSKRSNTAATRPRRSARIEKLRKSSESLNSTSRNKGRKVR